MARSKFRASVLETQFPFNSIASSQQRSVTLTDSQLYHGSLTSTGSDTAWRQCKQFIRPIGPKSTRRNNKWTVPPLHDSNSLEAKLVSGLLSSRGVCRPAWHQGRMPTRWWCDARSNR